MGRAGVRGRARGRRWRRWPARARRGSDARLPHDRDRALHRPLLRRRSTTSRAGSRSSPSARTARCRRRSITRRIDKTIIVVVDDTDSANGFAGVLPRNAIQLLRDRAGRLLRARRSRRLAVRPRRARVHAHPPPRHDVGPAEHLQPDLRQDVGAEPGHAALGDRGHRGLRGVEAIGGRPQPRHPLRSDHPDRAPRRARTCGSTRSAARRGSSRAATRRTSTARTSCATSSIGSATTRCARCRTCPARTRRRSRSTARSRRSSASRSPSCTTTGRRYLRDRYGMQEMAAERRGLASGRALTDVRRGATSCRTTPPTARSCSGSQYDGYSLTRVRAMPVGGDAAGRARRRADRCDGAVRSAAGWLARSTSRAGCSAASTRSRICSAGTRGPGRRCG